MSLMSKIIYELSLNALLEEGIWLCVIKALLHKHMLAQQHIHARHNLAIRRKRLDVQATCPRGWDGTSLVGSKGREWETESSLSPTMWRERGLKYYVAISLKQQLKSVQHWYTTVGHLSHRTHALPCYIHRSDRPVDLNNMQWGKSHPL